MIQLAEKKNPEPKTVWSSTTWDLGILSQQKFFILYTTKARISQIIQLKNRLKIYFCRLVIILSFYKHATSEDKTVQKESYQYLLNPLLNFFAEKKKKDMHQLSPQDAKHTN